MPKSSESDHSEASTGQDVTPPASAPQAATWIGGGCEWVAASPEETAKMFEAFRRVVACRTKLGLDVASTMRVVGETEAAAAVDAQEDAGDPARIIMIVEDETAALFNGSMTFVLQPAGDNPQPYPYYIEPGGAVGRQDVWKGSPARLVGFQRDLREKEVDLELDAFYKNPQQAVGMFAVFEDSEGEMWTREVPIASVRPTEPSKGAVRWNEVLEGYDGMRAKRRQPFLTQKGMFRLGEGAGLQDAVAIVDPKPGPWLPWTELIAKFDAANRALDATRTAKLDPGSAVAFNCGFTFAIELDGDDNDAELRTYYVKPGGELDRQQVWMGSMTSLVGFRGDADGVDVEVDLPVFYASPEGAVGLYPVFAFADGHRSTTGRSVSRVRPVPTEAAE
jgi:hypothetical protein